MFNRKGVGLFAIFFLFKFLLCTGYYVYSYDIDTTIHLYRGGLIYLHNDMMILDKQREVLCNDFYLFWLHRHNNSVAINNMYYTNFKYSMYINWDNVIQVDENIDETNIYINDLALEKKYIGLGFLFLSTISTALYFKNCIL